MAGISGIPDCVSIFRLHDAVRVVITAACLVGLIAFITYVLNASEDWYLGVISLGISLTALGVIAIGIIYFVVIKIVELRNANSSNANNSSNLLLDKASRLVKGKSDDSARTEGKG